MKRILQLVSLVLLLAPTGLEGLFCGSTVHAMDCPMVMQDCPMAGQMASLNCPENCCVQHSAIKVLPWARPVKPRMQAQQSAMMTVLAPPAAAAPAGPRRINAAAPSPPRFILLRVLRI